MDVIIPYKPQLDSQKNTQLGNVSGVGGLRHFNPDTDLVANQNVPHPIKQSYSTVTGPVQTFSHHNRSIMREKAISHVNRELHRFDLENRIRYLNGVGLPNVKAGFYKSV